MKHSTYSFGDVVFVIRHPAMGSCTITGEGTGSITVSYSTDVTQHDIAADGSVMVSKIIARNGTIALAVQQTSSANRWLERFMNYLRVAPTSEWAAASAVLDCNHTGEHFQIKGISPQKNPDSPFQATGQNITWNLMAVEIVKG